MFYDYKTVVFLDGEFVNAKQFGKVSLYSQTFLYGNGAFEGIRAYKTSHGVQIFKAKQHFERLKASATQIYIDLPYSVEKLEEIAYTLLEKNHLQNAYLRPVAFVGEGISLDSVNKTHFFMGAFKWAKYLGEKPLKTMVSSFQRPHPKAFPVETKCCGMYVNSVIASTEARRKGFQEAIMLDYQGFVSQAPGANLFYIKDNELFTPPSGSIFQGVTRQTILELAKQRNIPIHEKLFKIEDLQSADSAFLTGTAAEMVAIESVNEVDLKFGKNPQQTIYKELSESYMDLLRTFKPEQPLTII